MALFGGSKAGSGGAAGTARTQRHSSGWMMLSTHLRGAEGLRILDIGPTSAGNINFITSLGHSVYMANLVEDSARPEYLLPRSEDAVTGAPTYDVARFLSENLNFTGRHFDVVTLWDTADYLPEELVGPVIDRIHEVMAPGGRLLAFFHSKRIGDETVFSRYHLTATDHVDMQRIGIHAIRRAYTTRQIEQLFAQFASNKFFLAKDALREVIVNR
jgi:SAM-dependent methyltransferase